MAITHDSTPAPQNPIARQLVEVLRPHTPFAEAIVRRQAERAGVTLTALCADDLTRIVPMILSAAHVFVDGAALVSLRKALERVR